MKLINNSKTKFTTSKGEFKIGRVMEFSDEEAKILLRKKKDGSPVYAGISTPESLLDAAVEVVEKAEVETKAEARAKAEAKAEARAATKAAALAEAK